MGDHGNDGRNTSTRMPYIIRPIENTEGTCFLNAVLQNLLAIDTLRNCIARSVHLNYGPLSAALRKIFLDKTQWLGRSINPTPLFRAMCTTFPETYAPFKGANANRFVDHLLQGLSSEEFISTRLISSKRSYQGKKVSGVVDTMFCINIASEHGLEDERQSSKTTCLRVNIPFQDESVVRSHEGCLVVVHNQLLIPYVGTVSIERLLEFYMTQRHAKIVGAPPILIISLNRTSSLPGTIYDLMFNGRVTFKYTLDLKPYMDPNCTDRSGSYMYQLNGFVDRVRPNHVISWIKGTHLEGHSAWYYVDDSILTKLSAEKVLGHKPIILFYTKC